MNVASARFTRLALPCAALLAAGLTARAKAEEYVKSYSVTERPDVRVRIADGNVRVITSDAPQVEFRVKYDGYTLDKNLIIESRQEGNQVTFTTKMKYGITIGISNKKVSTEIRMPRTADLQLDTGDGAVEIASLSGNLTLSSGDGRLKVSQLSGNLDIRTGDGGISADTLKGDVRLRTGDGTIEALNLDGNCTVSSGDGMVRLAGRFDALDVKSGDGGVVARVAPGSAMSSSWTIRTGDGPVEVVLPRDFKANLDAATNDGHISLGIPVAIEGQVTPSKVRGKMNGGGPSLFIQTGDGSIRLNGT